MSTGQTFEILDDSGTLLGRFEDEAAAISALERLIAADPESMYDTFIAEFDAQGNRVETHFPSKPQPVAFGVIEVRGQITDRALARELSRPGRA